MYRYFISFELDGKIENTVLDLTRRLEKIQDIQLIENKLSLFGVEYPDGCFKDLDAKVINFQLLYAE